MGFRVFITGCAGYLARGLIQACREDPDVEWVGGNDVRTPPDTTGWQFFHFDVVDPGLADVFREHRVDTLVHLAWVFNPTHDPALEYRVDVEGTRNVLTCVLTAGVPYLIYLSSTTSYGPHPDNPTAVDEDYPRRGHPSYLYSKHKALVDTMVLEFMQAHPEVGVFMVRAPIVLGPNTRNIVTAMTDLPVMVGVRGYDPPLQFLHEEDMRRLLHWAVRRRPVGVFNVAGHGTLRYSEIVRRLRKPVVWLPAWLLYPLVALGWSLRLLPFPPSILDFIRYPWVGRTDRFAAQCDFEVRYSSEDALMAYARARWPHRYR